MAKFLLIVAPDKVKVYETVKRGLGSADHVELIIDRRRGDSGGHPSRPQGEQAERRRARIDDRLRTVGWVLVARN